MTGVRVTMARLKSSGRDNAVGLISIRDHLIEGSFYRAMLCIRGTSHGFVSVRHKSEFY